MRVLMLTDLEGVAGVASFSQVSTEGNHYEDAKKLLTGEINAAVEALASQGVDDIIVLDGHGPGAVCYEMLSPPARLVHGRPVAPNWIDHPSYGNIDFCVIIGQHAMAGIADGNLNHTQNSREIEYIKLNNKPIGEFAQFAYKQGLKGRPVIFISGDHAACREALHFVPEIVTAEVKTGLSRNCAISLSIAESHRKIRDGVVKAVQIFKVSPLQPLTLKGPYTIEVKFFHSERADRSANASTKRVDSLTVQFKSDDLNEILYCHRL